jgi:FkbM family methyltransferase
MRFSFRKFTLKNILWFLRRKLEGYYGQFTPPMDFVIARYFDPRFVGTCIEVGAADGVSCSNTLHFEQRGWECLCIEANPLHEESLRKHRKHVQMCGVADKSSAQSVFHVAEMTSGVYEAVSSLEIDERLLDAHRNILKGIRDVEIIVRTLDECAADFRRSRIDFITIDTEGTELRVLKGFDLARWKVPLLVIENNYADPEIEIYLKNFGYRMDRRYESNDFFVLPGSSQLRTFR